MSFIRVWFMGYFHPVRMFEQLRSKPAPQWGFFGALLRAILDSLLLYLPIAMMGWVPPTPSNVRLLPTEQYYWHLIWLSPLVLLAEWLIGAAFVHLVLRMVGRKSEFDQVLNIGGMEAIVVGAFLLLWDWIMITMGGVNQYFLGSSHLIIALWGVALAAIGMQRLLGVPYWLGGLLGFLCIPLGLPLAIMFMRSPI